VSHEREQMIEALGEMEDAAQDLERAYTKYLAAAGTLTRDAYPDANRQLTIEAVVGSAVLNTSLVRRIRALGMQGVLDQARTSGTVADLRTLRSKIASQVA